MLDYTTMHMNSIGKNNLFRYDEVFAKLILNYINSNEYSNLQFSDKPDLQDTVLSIGVEVTSAIGENQQELDKLYSNLINGKAKRKQKVIEKIKKLKGKIDENGVLYHPTYHRKLNNIRYAIENKLQKLNSENYRIFGNNYIFIFIIDFIREDEYNSLLKKYKIIQEEYKINFSKIFVFRLGGTLIEFDINDESYRIYIIKNSDVFDICCEANNIAKRDNSK